MARLLHAHMSDEQLAKQVSRGRREAFAELYKRHHQALFRYCRSILRDPEQAQDVLQNAMASAFVALGVGERDLAVRPWLFRIVHNEAISLLRRRRSQDVGVFEAALVASEDDVPERTLEQRERLASLLADLRALAERQRSALLMRELSGLTVPEIAQALSITPATAKQTLFEARSALRDMAKGRTADCDSIRRLIGEHDGRVLRSRLLLAHLRSCASCREYGQTIATRSADLRALAPPLPALAASAMLARLLGGSAAPHAAGVIANGAGTASSGIARAAAGATSSPASSATGGAMAAAGTPAVGAMSGLGAGLGVATSVKAIAALALVIAAGAGATHLALSGSGARRPSIGQRPSGARRSAIAHHRAQMPASPTVLGARATHAQAGSGAVSSATRGGVHRSGRSHLAGGDGRGAALRGQAPAPKRGQGSREHLRGRGKGEGAGGLRSRRQVARSPRAAHENGSTGSVPQGRRGTGSTGNAHAGGAQQRPPHHAAEKAPPGQVKGSSPTVNDARPVGEGPSLRSEQTQTAGQSQHGGSKSAR